MNLNRLLRPLALALLLATPALAQTASPTDAERAAQQELKLKALGLLEDVVKDSESFRHAENRIHVRALAANVFWDHDQARARILFKEAMAGLSDLLKNQEAGSEPENIRSNDGSRQLRRELMQLLAARDPRMAREFLRATRQQVAARPAGVRGPGPLDQPLELNLATQLAADDPKEALEIAEESLSGGLSYELPAVLTALRGKDPEAAAKLAAQIVVKLRLEKLGEDGAAKQVALALLSQATPTPGDGVKSTGSAPPLLDPPALRELIEMLAVEALRPDSTSPEILAALQEALPVVEKYAPARAAQLRRKAAQPERAKPGEDEEEGEEVEEWSQYNTVFEKGSADELITAAETAPGAMRELLYQRAAYKLMEAGDADRARQVIRERIKDPAQAKQMLAQLDEVAVVAAAERGNIEQARKMLDTLRTTEERVMGLTQLAGGAAAKGETKYALQLLDEAREMVSGRAKNFKQLVAQLTLARAYASLDASRSLAILEPVVDQLNELLAAGVVLGSFFAEELITDDEIMMDPLAAVTNEIFAHYLAEVGVLARADFERTRALADRFQRYEIRTAARLIVAQSVLSPRPLTQPGDGIRMTTTTTTPIVIEGSAP